MSTDKHPPGKTCSDCRNFAACKALIDVKGNETFCDWIPSRFAPAATLPEGDRHE